MNHTIRSLAACVCFAASLLSFTPLLRAEEGESSSSLLTTSRIFAKHEFDAKGWGPPQWLGESGKYAVLEKSELFKDAQDVVQCDAATGARAVLVSASRLIPPGQDKPLRIEGYSLSPDLKRLLIYTNSKRVWRQNTRGDYWIYDIEAKRLKKLGGSVRPSSMMFASLSPDGKKVAYVCQNNLFVQDLDSLEVTALTESKSPNIINGTADWVYEEEFHLYRGFRWSPDGKHIAYWQFDTSAVRTAHMVNNTDSLYQEVISFKYPKVGETNSACRVGIIDAAGGETRWLDTKADPSNHYIPEMEWTPDSQAVVFQQLNRLQNTNCLYQGDAETGQTSLLFTDKDDAWVDVMEQWHWIEKGRRFLWLSERDGWRHLYAVSRSGKAVSLLTPGEYDVISIAGVDEGLKCAYILASPENATRAYLYRVPLDGSGELKRVTPEEQTGTHAYSISGDGRYAAHTYSRFAQPPVTDLVTLPDHKRLRVVCSNAKLIKKLDALKPCPTEFFRVDIGGGVECDAWCIKPPDFDPAQKYPLLIHVYGEPAGQTVLDRWGGDNYLWHTMLAQQGYLVMSIDNRGTPAPRGREWRKCVYRQIGILAPADQAAAARKIIAERPYVDAERIGIWGWSGGGSMSLNAIFRYPELYRTAMAIAFISNQRLYDTIYQERYMGLPDDNEANYKKGSPVTHARNLQGNLLLVHGTGDDNCHYQSCEVLVNELIKRNKQFSMMAYPNRTHSIKEGPNTRRHLYETLTRYLQEHLPAGPMPR